MEAATFALMAKKPVQRSVRFVAENHEYVDALAQELFDAAVYTDKNYSMALNLILSYCRAKGITAKDLLATVLAENEKDSRKKQA